MMKRNTALEATWLKKFQEAMQPMNSDTPVSVKIKGKLATGILLPKPLMPTDTQVSQQLSTTAGGTAHDLQLLHFSSPARLPRTLAGFLASLLSRIAGDLG